MNTYKVMSGLCQDKTFEAVSLVSDEDLKKRGIERGKDKTVYYAGDVIRTEKDLSGLNINRRKFQLLQEHEPISAEPAKEDAIARMSVPQLKEFAAQEEIDLGDATLKADIAAICRAAFVDKMVPA